MKQYEMILPKNNIISRAMIEIIIVPTKFAIIIILKLTAFSYLG
jgi:hypothetical protein